MSKSINSSLMSVTIHVSFFLSSQNTQLSAHIKPRNRHSSPCLPNAIHEHLAFHFVSAFHSTYFVTRPHNTETSTPPWRVHIEERSSVSQFSKHTEPFTSFISSKRAVLTCPRVFMCVKNLDTNACPRQTQSSRPGWPQT